MLLAGATAAVWLALGRGGPWLGIEAIFPGLLVSALSVVGVGRRPAPRGPSGGDAMHGGAAADRQAALRE
jgi:hypothetical protein